MRLALLNDYAFVRRPDGIFTQRAYGHYVDALAPYFDRVLVIAPAAPPDLCRGLDYRLDAPHVELLPLPYFDAWSGSLAATLAAPRVLRRRRAEWDVLYVRVPTPLAFLAVPLAWALGRPVCLHAVTDLLEAMRDYPGPARPIACGVGRLAEAYTVAMGARALTITQGAALARRFSRRGRPVESLIGSPLRAADIQPREFAPLGRPIRLLYVGAFLEKKGLHFLLEAVDRLRADLPVVLTLVGSGPWESHVRREVAARRLEDIVRFTGNVGDDETLLSYYRRADLFVFPSLAEGFPRVLVEAMGQGLPVVSTAVGGVPELIRSGWNGVLVEPGSGAALAAGIASVVEDDALRERLTLNGVETARAHTREAFAEAFVRRLEAYVQRHHGPAVAVPRARPGASR